MKRGILAYRAAYPDIKFEVLCVSVAQHQYPHKAPVSDSSTTHGSSDGASSMAGSDTAGSNSPSSGSGHASRAGGGGSHEQTDAAAGLVSAQQQSGEQEQPCCSVFVHWAASGTNLGPIREAPPSGKQVSFTGRHEC